MRGQPVMRTLAALVMTGKIRRLPLDGLLSRQMRHSPTKGLVVRRQPEASCAAARAWVMARR